MRFGGNGRGTRAGVAEPRSLTSEVVDLSSDYSLHLRSLTLSSAFSRFLEFEHDHEPISVRAFLIDLSSEAFEGALSRFVYLLLRACGHSLSVKI